MRDQQRGGSTLGVGPNSVDERDPSLLPGASAGARPSPSSPSACKEAHRPRVSKTGGCRFESCRPCPLYGSDDLMDAF